MSININRRDFLKATGTTAVALAAGTSVMATGFASDKKEGQYDLVSEKKKELLHCRTLGFVNSVL